MERDVFFKKFKNLTIGIINESQSKVYFSDFTKKPKKYLHITLWQIFLPIILVFFATTFIYYLLEPTISASKRYQNVWTVFFETYKILMGTFTVVLVTLFLTNRWQQRSYSFEMIKELNSPEFLQIRNNLSNRMKQAVIEKIDIDDVSGWFPFSDSIINGISNRSPVFSQYTLENFIKEHALSNMLYFILRLSNYYKFDMLNVRLTRHLFHFFFCHYEIVMLEFAESLKKCRSELNLQGYPYDERWDLVSDDVKKFFNFIGLSGTLNSEHIYIYFPSMNDITK